ncbi:hypothetical protein T4B_15616 [Trichinella pseudospiralis]|uniref:Uncharacterized protein n=1 Tax=Trichinella pseudospiralis TaxID=6337 RepID=A0A0V1GNB8_TRIPS|nr:hypothetical protein T4B_15616 [Trichinella pseudospiralis]
MGVALLSGCLYRSRSCLKSSSITRPPRDPAIEQRSATFAGTDKSPPESSSAVLTRDLLSASVSVFSSPGQMIRVVSHPEELFHADLSIPKLRYSSANMSRLLVKRIYEIEMILRPFHWPAYAVENGEELANELLQFLVIVVSQRLYMPIKVAAMSALLSGRVASEVATLLFGRDDDVVYSVGVIDRPDLRRLSRSNTNLVDYLLSFITFVAWRCGVDVLLEGALALQMPMADNAAR